LELVAREIVQPPEVETHRYKRGERLGGKAAERLKGLHVYICDGAIALRVPAGRSPSVLLEVFGPGRLLPPWLWETKSGPGMEGRYATALTPTTTWELPPDVFERQVAQYPPLAASLASLNASGGAMSLDRLAMLALRDPLRRVAHTLLLLLDRLTAPGATPGARLDASQELIAAFASLSRQTTNRQLRRLARAGVTASQRRAVDVRDLAGLRGVAAGRRPLGR